MMEGHLLPEVNLRLAERLKERRVDHRMVRQLEHQRQPERCKLVERRARLMNRHGHGHDRAHPILPNHYHRHCCRHDHHYRSTQDPCRNTRTVSSRVQVRMRLQSFHHTVQDLVQREEQGSSHVARYRAHVSDEALRGR